MRSVLQLGTWTVRIMLQEGKMQDIFNELQKYNTHIVTLQETRWPNEGWIDKKDYTLIYGDETNIIGRNCTVFILYKDSRKGLIGFQPMNGGISKYE
jgi:hypothetical protein